jgi:uncharacterized delta-60 repeat protein
VVAGETTIADAGEFVLLRYNTDGSLDPSFGDGGKVLTSFGCGSEGANAIAIQPDGKILAAGFAGSAIAVARYQADGSLDPSWDGDGRATFAATGELARQRHRIAEQRQGGGRRFAVRRNIQLGRGSLQCGWISRHVVSMAMVSWSRRSSR